MTKAGTINHDIQRQNFDHNWKSITDGKDKEMTKLSWGLSWRSARTSRGNLASEVGHVSFNTYFAGRASFT